MFLLSALLFPLVTFAATDTTYECSLGNGNNEYSVTLGAVDSATMEGPISIDFAGYRIGALFRGTYTAYPKQPLKFVVVTGDEPESLMSGSIALGAPRIFVKKGPSYVEHQKTWIDCVKTK